MSEKFKSLFHRNYVGGVGEIEIPDFKLPPSEGIRGRSFEDILAEYRWYVHDPEAELPKDILDELRKIGKIPE